MSIVFFGYFPNIKL